MFSLRPTSLNPANAWLCFHTYMLCIALGRACLTLAHICTHLLQEGGSEGGREGGREGRREIQARKWSGVYFAPAIRMT